MTTTTYLQKDTRVSYTFVVPQQGFNVDTAQQLSAVAEAYKKAYGTISMYIEGDSSVVRNATESENFEKLRPGSVVTLKLAKSEEELEARTISDLEKIVQKAKEQTA